MFLDWITRILMTSEYSIHAGELPGVEDTLGSWAGVCAGSAFVIGWVFPNVSAQTILMTVSVILMTWSRYEQFKRNNYRKWDRARKGLDSDDDIDIKPKKFSHL